VSVVDGFCPVCSAVVEGGRVEHVRGCAAVTPNARCPSCEGLALHRDDCPVQLWLDRMGVAAKVEREAAAVLLSDLHFGPFRTASEMADELRSTDIGPAAARAPLPLAEYRVTVLLPEGPVPNEAADEALALVEQVVFTALPRMLAAAAIPLGPGVRVIVEVAEED
jgi:hypothetical protein